MDELTSVFIQESQEQLLTLEKGLLLLESTPDDEDNINAIFRAAHTIKGASGVIECHFIESFVHKIENILDRLRNHEIQVSSELTGLLLEACDHISVLVDVLEAEEAEPSSGVYAVGNNILSRLVQCAPSAALNPAPEPPAIIEANSPQVDGAVIVDAWHISVRFGADLMRGGMDPLSFIRFLGVRGEILTLETIFGAMPPADEMDPETCYLGFEVRLQTQASKAEIEQVFDFCSDACDLHILPPRSVSSAYIELIRQLPEDEMRIGEILVRCGALTQKELEIGLQAQKKATAEQPHSEDAPPPFVPLGEILVQQKLIEPTIVEAAVEKQTKISEKKAVEARTIRVQADKLDQLIDLVGELVIAGAATNLLAQNSGQRNLLEACSLLSRLVENIRDSALRLRMVQIGETFSRFNRVVRDVSRELGKDIELVITGAETELDKSVVEKIGDPLMHLVRNSMDHGIEAADVRRARGKNPKGRLELNAFHDSGSIVIEVKDDGGGLNRERILQKAHDKGLVLPGQVLSDQEIFNLIWEPGFSTVDKVSNLSGRGVGMDVVKKNLQALRGSCEVTSQAGRGTCFSIRLPLTLAIIDGFLVEVGSSAYVIPLDMVTECIESPCTASEQEYLNLRGAVLPFIRLRELFQVKGEAPERENVVVVNYAGFKAGLVVDRLLGEFQTVIKPLSSIFRHLKGIGGSTILGSGEVALILDVQSLIERTIQKDTKLPPPPLPPPVV